MADVLAVLKDVIVPMPVYVAAIIFVAVAIGGFVRGFLGFGGAMVIIMVLNVVLGAHYAVPISCLAGVLPTLQLLPTAFRSADRRFVLPFCVASMLAVPVGTVVLVTLDAALMKIVVAALVLAVVAMLFYGWRGPHQPTTSVTLGAGVGAGLIQGVAGVGGPPAVAVALARPGDAETQRANVIGVITPLSLSPLVPLWYFGLFTKEVVVLSALIIPLYMLLTRIGARYFSGSGREHYRAGALVDLGIMGCVTLLIAVRDYITTA